MKTISVSGGAITIEAGRVVGGWCKVCCGGDPRLVRQGQIECYAGHVIASAEEVAECLTPTDPTPEQIMDMAPREFALAFYGPCIDCPLHECNALTRARCENGGRYPL